MKKIEQILTKIEPPNWVLAVLAAILLLRIPSFFEPYFYGDEMIYVTLGGAIRKGLTLYQQIHDNKPPLLYLTAAVAGNLFWFKAILAFWMLGTTIAFWHLTKKLFQHAGEAGKLGQKVAVCIFALLTTLPLLEGNIINAELFLIGPIIIALTLLLTETNVKNIFLAGILLGIGVLYKFPAIFDAPVFIVFLFITSKFSLKSYVDIVKKGVVLFLGLATPILITLVFFYLKGALSDYVRAAFLENLGYISTWNGGPQQSFLAKHGALLFRAAIVLLGFVILKIRSSKLSQPFVIACIWVLTSLFAVTLSERPYPHYLIQSIPSISILIGILFSSQKFEQVLTIIPLTLAVIVPIYYKFYFYKTFSYYERFASYATGQITKTEFYNKFDNTTQSNYETAKTIVKLTNDNQKVFVWGNDAPTIYALTKRFPPFKYVADYHITDYSSLDATAKLLKSTPPALIVILPDAPKWKGLDNLISTNYVLISNSNNIEIWHELSL